MMTKDEALKMAIEAMERAEQVSVVAYSKDYEKEIQACKEALATNEESSTVQPAQDTVIYQTAIEAARDVCKYLDFGKIDDAKALTVFFWDAMDRVRELEND